MKRYSQSVITSRVIVIKLELTAHGSVGGEGKKERLEERSKARTKKKETGLDGLNPDGSIPDMVVPVLGGF